MASKYQIRADGEVLADLMQPEYSYFNAQLKQGVNIAGSLSFSLLPTNPVANNLSPLKTTITLRKNGKTIWSGRVVKIEKNINNQYKVVCEGALSWLHDVLIPPTEFFSKSLHEIVSTAIDSYNSNCSENRIFLTGEIDGADILTLSKSDEYRTPFDILKEIVALNGGYFIVTYQQDGTPVLNYYKDAKESQKEVRFGENLIDLNECIDATKIMTVLYAEGDGVSLPSAFISNSAAVSVYGKVFGYVKFENVTTEEELTERAVAYLNQNMLGDFSITVKAIALDWEAQIGESIRAVSKPNGVDVRMVVSEISTNLNNDADSRITIGTTRKTLTKILAVEGKNA